MSDLDTRALNCFLRLPKELIFTFMNTGQLTEELFITRKAEFIYLRDYISKHGQAPSLPLFKRKFPDFDCFKVKDPFEVFVEELLQRVQRNTMVELVNAIGNDDQLLEDLDGCIEKLNATAIQIAQYDPSNSDHEYTTGYDDRIRRYNDRKQNLALMTFTTGCATMDTYLGGGLFAPQLGVLAADPKMGKTWWLVNCAVANYRAGKSVLIITPEMSHAEIEQRIDAMRFELPYDQLRMGKLTKKQEARWKARAKKDTLPLHIVDATEAAFTPAHLRAKVELYKPNIVLVDSAYMMQCDNPDGNYQDSHKLVKQIKTILKDCNIPGWFVVQMKRESEVDKDVSESAFRRIYGGDHWSQSCDVMLRLTGARSDKFRKLVLLANREGETFKEDVIGYSFDPSPEIGSVDSFKADEADLEEGDEYVEVKI